MSDRASQREINPCPAAPTPPDVSRDDMGRLSRLVNTGRCVVEQVREKLTLVLLHLPLQMSAEMKWEGRVGK